MVSEFVLLSAVGFGFAHAFEPDHMAAVSTFVANRPTPKEAFSFGLKWAIGHGAALFLLGGALFLAKRASESAQPGLFSSGVLEQIVGVVLVLLGLNAIRQIFWGAKTIHSHSHNNPEPINNASRKISPESARVLWGGSVLMGLLHGAAGTGAFIGQAAISLSRDFTSALVYTLLFSLGVLAAMAIYAGTLGGAISLGAQKSRKLLQGARAFVGALTVVIGFCLIRGVALPGLFDGILSH